MNDDALTRNEQGELAVRTVSTSGDNYVDKNDVYTRDNDGKLCIRTVGNGGGGSDSHNLGWYATESALTTAHATAEDGDFAIVGSTDTVWVWDSDSSAWVDTGVKDVTTYLTYPNTWSTTGTTKAFCDAIAADNTAIVGKAYLGEVTLSDLPSSMVNGEVVVEIMSGTTALNKVIVLSLKSGNVTPYAWQYVYWNGGSSTSGWQTWQEPLVSGTNIKTINNTSLLGSGNITTTTVTFRTWGANE